MHASLPGVPRRRLGLLVAGLFATVPHFHAIAQEATVGAMLTVTVTVTGERESEAKQARSRGALGSLSDLETPFATATVGSEQLEDRQVTTLANVFSEDASVSTKGGTYTQSSYAINVRGLTLDFTNGYKIDGQPFQMYGVELPLETVESVQLLKGATGFLYGFAAPGGIINYVTKRPTEERTFSASAGYTSGGLVREHIDVGGRAGADNRFGYRLNLAHEEGDTYNGASLKRDAASLALGARLAKDVTWSANFLYQERDLLGGVPTVSLQAYPAASVGLPVALDGQADLGAYPTTYYDSTMYMGTTALDWRINRDWKLNVNYGYSLKRIDSSIETLYLTSRSGNYSNRLNPFYRPELTYHAVNALVEGGFTTGALRHRVSFGAGRQTLTRMLNVQSALSLFGPNTVGNLYAPPPALVDTSFNDPRVFKISDYAQKSLFASDNIDIGEHWSVLAGVRWMDYRNLNWNAAGAQTSDYHEKPTTPTVALLYKPSSNTTVYASYVEALEDGGTVATTYANANESLPPLTSRQAELGVKTDQGNWGASAAVFRVKRGGGLRGLQQQPAGHLRAGRRTALPGTGSEWPRRPATLADRQRWRHLARCRVSCHDAGDRGQPHREHAALPGRAGRERESAASGRSFAACGCQLRRRAEGEQCQHVRGAGSDAGERRRRVPHAHPRPLRNVPRAGEQPGESRLLVFDKLEHAADRCAAPGVRQRALRLLRQDASSPRRIGPMVTRAVRSVLARPRGHLRAWTREPRPVARTPVIRNFARH
ncbi:TonB-dependent receptor [Pseudoduganella lutea]|uniref:TonB-dependent receptor n=1 Tax=Pseudoduganella lutea TaxID=321985 RepID=A0A4P6KRJ6_9BURK|nr:TonB-dependent receptor [Pseudoduganella lutea]QBE61701.1 TonB-dependent receptor [Pseudoduganella lutea]